MPLQRRQETPQTPRQAPHVAERTPQRNPRGRGRPRPAPPAPGRLYLDDYGQPGTLVLVHVHRPFPDPQVVRVQGRARPEERELAHGSQGVLGVSGTHSLARGTLARRFIAGAARGRPPAAGREEGGGGLRGAGREAERRARRRGRGARRDGRGDWQEMLRSWPCALGPWHPLGVQTQLVGRRAFSRPPASQPPLPTAGEAPLPVAFGLFSVRRCRRPPLPGTPRPYCPSRALCVAGQVILRRRRQASAGNSQSTPGNPEPGPPPHLLGSEQTHGSQNQAWTFPGSRHHLQPVDGVSESIALAKCNS